MYHSYRWTLDKLKRRLDVIAPLVYRATVPLGTFYYLQVDGPAFDPALVQTEDLSGWVEVHPGEYWAPSNSHFVLRTVFRIPPEWASGGPVGLYLPLGDAHDFSHPEALAWIDGRTYAACDRHHQEII